MSSSRSKSKKQLDDKSSKDKNKEKENSKKVEKGTNKKSSKPDFSPEIGALWLTLQLSVSETGGNLFNEIDADKLEALVKESIAYNQNLDKSGYALIENVLSPSAANKTQLESLKQVISTIESKLNEFEAQFKTWEKINNSAAGKLVGRDERLKLLPTSIQVRSDLIDLDAKQRATCEVYTRAIARVLGDTKTAKAKISGYQARLNAKLQPSGVGSQVSSFPPATANSNPAPTGEKAPEKKSSKIKVGQ